MNKTKVPNPVQGKMCKNRSMPMIRVNQNGENKGQQKYQREHWCCPKLDKLNCLESHKSKTTGHKVPSEHLLRALSCCKAMVFTLTYAHL